MSATTAAPASSSSAAPTMRAARLVSPVQGGMSTGGFSRENLAQCIEVRDVPVPRPRAGQVLIRVQRAAINPADLSMLKGTYGMKTAGGSTDEAKQEQNQKSEGASASASDEGSMEPLPVGSEGCGTVVRSGGGLMAWRLVGKRVAFSGSRDGAWSEYVVCPATRCMPMPESVPFDACASCFVNPMTAISFIEIAQAGDHRVIMHSAAASALGQMVIRYAKRNGIDVVCIVRREEQAEICRQAGANDDLIFNSADDDFHAKLSAKCAEVSCTLGFDAVSGELSGTMLNAMPNGATLRLYGGLSEQPPSRISTKDLIFRQKTLTGFWLSEYVKSKSLWQLWNWSSIVTSRILDDFSQEVVKAVPLENVTDALADYVANMSAGKVLVDCSEQDAHNS